MTDVSEKTPAGASVHLGSIAAIIGGVAAIAGAVAALVKVFAPGEPVTREEVRTASTVQAAPRAPLAAVKFRKLLWGPSDCATERPRIGLGGCVDFRELGWLEGQVAFLRDRRVGGFRDLPRVFRLEARSLGAKLNWTLAVVAQGRAQWMLGVGYDAATTAKDGALRLYPMNSGQALSPPVFLDEAHDWVVDGKTIEAVEH